MTLFGYKQTPEHRKKNSDSKKGISTWNKGIKMPRYIVEKQSKARIGKKRTPEQCKKISLSLVGKKTGRVPKSAFKKGSKPWNTGKKGVQKWSIESRLKASLSKRGENCRFWKGGLTPINIKIRRGLEYRLWREAVFKRDNWTCVWCGKVGNKLNADHIKPFSLFPELRFAIDNGRTLCHDCHKKTDTYGYKSFIKHE